MQKLRAAYRVTVIIGLAMMASLVAYLVVVSLIENGSIAVGGEASVQGEKTEFLKFAFLGVSIILVLLIRIVNRILLKTGADRPGMRGERRFPEQEDVLDTGPLVNAAVITFALCEVPSVLGLVLYFLARSVTDFYLFLIISLFAFSFHFPRFSQWEAWAKQRH